MSAKIIIVKLKIFIIATLISSGFFTGPSLASEVLRLSKGQTVFVPLYSNIFIKDWEVNWKLLAFLSIRNTDPSNSITILAVDYYDTNGKLVRKHLSEPRQLNPMASADYHVKSSDTSAGWGGKFIVRWNADKDISEPVIESLITGALGTHSVSFTTQGRVLPK